MTAPRRMHRFALGIVLLALGALALSGCSDGAADKAISEPYYLESEDTGEYYLQSKLHRVEEGGLAGGPVLKIGWSGTTILVFRSGENYGYDDIKVPDGWMAVDTKTNKIEGPISDSERQARFPNIVCYPVEVAWSKL